MSGFKLVVQNIGRLAFTTIMANILILLGKVEIALVSALSCALVLWQRQESKERKRCDVIVKRSSIKEKCKISNSNCATRWPNRLKHSVD